MRNIQSLPKLDVEQVLRWCDAHRRRTGKWPTARDGAIRIVAALVNAIEAPERESVLLLNTTPGAVDLANWSIANKDKRKLPLQGQVGSGETLAVRMTPDVPLSNDGGIITLLDAQGLKVDGVSYTGADASKPGWTIVF